MDEQTLEPCRKCGAAENVMLDQMSARHGNRYVRYCDKCDWSTETFDTPEEATAAWNTRVIAGKVAELTDALEPFAAVAAKLNPDLPDDTPITLTLDGGVLYVFALKRFRKARAALAPYPERRSESHE